MKQEYMKCNMKDTGAGGAIYFLGFLGAAIFYIGQAETFWAGVLGFLEAIIWPVFVVYHLLQFLIG